ncbi:YHYH protein [Frigidibacter sp. ROC022]|uniref:YHYH protein n=1 Tax=Frigidibacter sp. ROC022 TaxID=2971796 RepID=UPI00215A66D6|nr:YHYH protein [Frigidibacter sp. ROC022]MCR8725335.1 YHYH protein [Frigidibacter sp. ROC022]
MIRSALFLCLLPLAAAAHDNQSRITTRGDMTCISSNGAPNHEMGRFPNRANPNAFREQHLTFCFPSEPKLAGKTTKGLMTVGVSLTGVPFRPYTAGYYDPDGRGGFSSDPSSGWRQQAMYAPRKLGMDAQNAHVDRSGLYHYHATSPAYVASLDGNPIGFAPDGFEIHYEPGRVSSSYRLKSGDRPTAPFGPHDGTFEEDFEYVEGAGTLDECNGMMVGGSYRYYATDSYPYFPRCFKGVVNPGFISRG